MKVFAGFCLFCILCGLTFKPLPKKPKTNCIRTVVDQSCSPRLLTNLPFMLLCFSNLFATQGLYIPYTFLPKLAIERGVSELNAAFLISIVGICNTIGRILSGLLTDLPGASYIRIWNTHICQRICCFHWSTNCRMVGWQVWSDGKRFLSLCSSTICFSHHLCCILACSKSSGEEEKQLSFDV